MLKEAMENVKRETQLVTSGNKRDHLGDHAQSKKQKVESGIRCDFCGKGHDVS